MSDGLCECGCGERTRLAPFSSRSRGWIKGEPIRFINGHRLGRRSVTDGKLLCGECGEMKPLDEFYDNPNGGVTGKAHYCIPCARGINRKNNLLLKYGLTLAEYDDLLAKQGGVCAICEGPPTRKAQHLDVDHCHDSGKVRGLLCRDCNVAIGHFRNDPAALRRAIAYLEDS